MKRMNYCTEGAELTLYIKSSLNSSGVRGSASADEREGDGMSAWQGEEERKIK